MRIRRRHYLLMGISWLYILWSIGPAVVAIAFSFNSGRSRSVWQGFSTRWWVDATDSIVHNDVYRNAIVQSFTLATLNVLIAVPLGITLAVALSRWHGLGSRSLGFAATLGLVVPELVLAISVFLLLTRMLTFVHLGTLAQVIGQVTVSLPFVLVIARGRLASVSTELEEAAMDLGASPRQTLRLILIPVLQPAIVASAIVAFAVSIDDFVITQYLSSDESTQTVPLLIYNTVRGTATPALNATAALMVGITSVLAGLGALLYVLAARRQAITSIATAALAPLPTEQGKRGF